MKIFQNHRLKGAISIFLIIITIPTMLFSAVLIDGSRMASARAMTQEAADLAAVSALASYNQPLKDQFGLFAVDDNEKLEEIYKESLNATLLAYGMSGDAEYSERLWDIMKTTLTGQQSYMDASFLNLYDFSVDECTVQPQFCLAEQSVLENQMVEYAKFRGLYVMTDRLDIFSSLGYARADAKKNEVAAEVMQDKMEVDEKNAAAYQELKPLQDEINSLNEAVSHVKNAKTSYFASLRGKMEQIRIDNIDTEETLSKSDRQAADSYEENRAALKTAAETACKQAGKVLKQAEKAKTKVESAVDCLEDFRSRNQGKASGNESVEKLMQEANDNIQVYGTDYLPQIQKLLDDSVLKEMKQDSDIKSTLDKTMKEIHTAVTAYIETIEQMREDMENNASDDNSEDSQDEDSQEDSEEEEITEYYYFYLNSSESTESIDAVIRGRESTRCYEPVINKQLSYFMNSSWNAQGVNPYKKYENMSSGTGVEELVKGNSNSKGNAETSMEGEGTSGEIEKSIYDRRPSKNFTQEANINTPVNNNSNDLNASKNILNQGKHSMILDIGETVRDDVLCMTYIFGTFKTRLTGVKKFSSEGVSSSDKNSKYMPKWRYAHPEGELDMRFAPKKDRDTVLRSEIEYLVYGNRSDTLNEAAVYATILAERLANNMIAIHSVDAINNSCHVAAGAASLATYGVIPEPVFFWIFLTAWATAETLIEMDYLLSGGYKIPLIKTSKNVLLNVSTNAIGQDLISHYGDKGPFVTYEDYLLLLLLLKGREKRIMRSADLIEVNMKKNGEQDFTMDKAFTYLRADTKLSIRYLFGGVMPFQADYDKNGYSGRMHFSNTIYMGY